MLCTALAMAVAQNAVDPYLLDINGPGRVTVREGLTCTEDGQRATLKDIVSSAEGKRFVIVGESHDQAPHHEFQSQVIQALVDAGRDVVVGFEMFTRDNQENLAPWTTGAWTKDEFIENAHWKTQWGFDFGLYEPIFDVIQQNRLPMVALNVPRDWIRQVGKNGLSSLTEQQRKWIPDPYLGNTKHRELFTSMMGGHPLTGDQGNNIYSAQVCWDEGMATTAVHFMNSRYDRKLVMVIVAGSGHMMYGQAINYRIWRKTGEACVNVMCVSSDKPRQVSRGIADYVFVG